MPAKFETGRAHSNPVMESRRKLRLGFALLLVMVVGLLTYGTFGTRLDRGELNLLDSQKALQQLNAIKEESSQKNPVAVAANTKAARIVTCPACRLNSLPLVKKFVYELAPHFKPLLAVEWKVGYDPVLHLSENGKEVETVPLAVCLYFTLGRPSKVTTLWHLPTLTNFSYGAEIQLGRHYSKIGVVWNQPTDAQCGDCRRYPEDGVAKGGHEEGEYAGGGHAGLVIRRNKSVVSFIILVDQVT